jgi:tetratricopeptide (TPR) repeat protein
MADKADLVQTARSLLDPRNRLEFWREVPLVTNPLLGAGFGNFPIVATPPDREGKVKTLNWEVHNDYLQAYVDLGVPGAVLFLGVFIILILLAWRGRERGLILAAGASIVGLAVMQFTIFTMEVVSSQVWIAGVAALLNREAGGRPRKTFRRPSGIVLPLNYLAALGLLLLAGVIGLTIRGDREFRRGREEFERVLAYQEALRQPDGYPEETLDRIRRELEYTRPRLQVRLRHLADRVLPKMLFDANMRHITCHQFAGLAWSLNDYHLTEKFSRKALDLHPYDRTALTYLAAIALREGRFEAAFNYLKRGVEIFGYNPYHPFFSDNLVRLYRSRGGNDQAVYIEEQLAANTVSPPTGPSPPNLARNVPVDVILDWDESRADESYDVYIWSTGSPAPEAPSFSDLRVSRLPGKSRFQPGTTYIWRVRAVGRYGEELGDPWIFRTENRTENTVDLPPTH